MTYIFFTSKDCGLCKRLKPKVEQLQKLKCDIHIKDVFEFAKLSQMCGVGRLPTLVETDVDTIIERFAPEQVETKLNELLKALSN